jgi:hypothetical protein
VSRHFSTNDKSLNVANSTRTLRGFVLTATMNSAGIGLSPVLPSAPKGARAYFRKASSSI